MSEIIRTPAIAKIIGCTVNQARYNIRNNVWHFGRVVKRGNKRFCESTITDVAKYIGISREEAIRRLEEGEDKQ